MRILVIGLPGSGKTRFAGELSRKLNIPHIEVDKWFWGKGAVPDEVLRERIRPLLEGKEWVIEGHFSKLSADVLPLVDKVVWLDYPFSLTLRRALSRFFKERALPLKQRFRFLKLRHRRKLNSAFSEAFALCRKRGVVSERLS